MNPFISYIVIGLLCFNGVRLENSAQPRIRLTTPSSAVCKDVAKNCKENLHMCAEPKNQVGNDEYLKKTVGPSEMHTVSISLIKGR